MNGIKSFIDKGKGETYLKNVFFKEEK